MLYRQGEHWFITAADKAARRPAKARLKTEDMEVYVDPRAEWKQMFHEVWRIERDFFYDPHFHGLNLQTAERPTRPSGGHRQPRRLQLSARRHARQHQRAAHVRGRRQASGHPECEGGPARRRLHIENGRYRFARIFNGENWNPQLHAPLTQPGVNVKEGEYLLAVNGRDLHASDEIYSFFQETAGKQTVLKVGPHPDGSGSREVTVVPVESEAALRDLAWIEGNRRKVDELSGGKLAYVYLPNTARRRLHQFQPLLLRPGGERGRGAG